MSSLPESPNATTRPDYHFRAKSGSLAEKIGGILFPWWSTSSSTSSSTALISDITVKDIRACKRIGVGGFGEVYVFKHPTKGKVALKQLSVKGTRGDDMRRRALREGDTWAMLKHPNVLQFFGILETTTDLYLVSPYAKNGSLKGYVVLHPSVDRSALLCETAAAIEFLHEHGIVHGDLKASNILVSDDVRALLCDFGLARPVTAATSIGLQGIGTIPYQSPELLIEGGGKTFASDIWAFGMTIYEVLSDSMPFHQYATPVAVITAIVIKDERPPTLPSGSVSGASYGRLWEVAGACWQKDLTQRPTMEYVHRRLMTDTDVLQGKNLAMVRVPGLKAVACVGRSLPTQDAGPRAQRSMANRPTDSPRDPPAFPIQPLNFPQESLPQRSPETTTGGAVGSPVTAAQFALNQTDNLPPRSPTSTSSASSSRIRSKSTSSIRNEPFVPPREPVRTRSPPPSLARDAMPQYFVSETGGSGAVTPLSDVDFAILQELNLSALIQDIAPTPLASGGFSSVDRGSMIRDGTVTAVAIKSLRSACTKEVEIMGIDQIPQRMKIRLAREMRIWIGLRYPLILRPLGPAFLKNKVCLVSQWYDNGNVKEYLARNPMANQRRMVLQAAEGLVYLHSRSPPVVHSNIKSANVLVNDTGDVVLCDLGLSKLLYEGPTGFTRSNQEFDTLRSSAPELLEGQPHTTESDVYAFGCLTLEIMTGKCAFYELKSNTAVVTLVCLGRTPYAADYLELPSDDPLWDFMRRCWRKDHKLRPTIFEAHAQLIEIC